MASMLGTCNWGGQDFEIHPINAPWAAVPGLYIFAKKASATQWHALYIGQTNSFAERLPNHEMELPAKRGGATHIHVLVVHDGRQRDLIERNLIRSMQPTLNTQHAA